MYLLIYKAVHSGITFRCDITIGTINKNTWCLQMHKPNLHAVVGGRSSLENPSKYLRKIQKISAQKNDLPQ